MNELTFTLSQIPTMPDGTRFSAVPDGWDIGDPIGYGRDIQSAIEDLLEDYELTFDTQPLTYKWK